MGGNFEDYIRSLSCHVFGPVNHGQNWKGWYRSGEKGLIISDNQDETCLIITINDTSIGDLPLIITISATCKNQPKRLDSDNTINLSRLIVSLVLESEVTESVDCDSVSDEIRRWSSLSEDEFQRFVSDEDGVLNEFEMMCQLSILFPFVPGSMFR